MSIGEKVLTSSLVDASESVAKQSIDGEVTMTKTLTDVVSNGVAGAVTKGVSVLGKVAERATNALSRNSSNSLANANLKMANVIQHALSKTTSGAVGNANQSMSDTALKNAKVHAPFAPNKIIATQDATRNNGLPLLKN